MAQATRELLELCPGGSPTVGCVRFCVPRCAGDPNQEMVMSPFWAADTGAVGVYVGKAATMCDCLTFTGAPGLTSRTDANFCCFLIGTEHHGPPSGTNSARQSPALQHRPVGQSQANHVPGDRWGCSSQVLAFSLIAPPPEASCPVVPDKWGWKRAAVAPTVPHLVLPQAHRDCCLLRLSRAKQRQSLPLVPCPFC